MVIQENREHIWVIFIAESTGTFPNFYPIGAFESHDRAVSELNLLPADQHYQLLKLPVNRMFPYYHKQTGKITGMKGIHHEHFDRL